MDRGRNGEGGCVGEDGAAGEEVALENAGCDGESVAEVSEAAE